MKYRNNLQRVSTKATISNFGREVIKKTYKTCSKRFRKAFLKLGLEMRELTWMAAMPTNELTVLLNVSSFESISRSHSWIPYGLSTASDRMIDSRKQSKVIRSRPMCGHWVPIPANTNHTGRTSDDTFWTNKQTHHTLIFGFWLYDLSFLAPCLKPSPAWHRQPVLLTYIASWTTQCNVLKLGFHYPSWRPELTARAHPSTPPVLTGNGNRSPVNSGP